MKQYMPNDELKYQIQIKQYKRHPKWSKRKWLRILWILFIPAFCLVFFLYTYQYHGEVSFFTVGCFGVAPVGLGIVPAIVYRMFLMMACECVTAYHDKDYLLINDEDITYYYHPRNKEDQLIYDMITFKYADIQKIVHNEYHERIDIYGKHDFVRYHNIKVRKAIDEKGKDIDKEKLRLYLYYDKNEEILNLIQEKSGVNIEKINYPEY